MKTAMKTLLSAVLAAGMIAGGWGAMNPAPATPTTSVVLVANGNKDAGNGDNFNAPDSYRNDNRANRDNKPGSVAGNANFNSDYNKNRADAKNGGQAGNLNDDSDRTRTRPRLRLAAVAIERQR